MTQTIVDETQIDPVVLAHWRQCRCEFCMEELTTRGLAVEAPEAPPDITPKPTEPPKMTPQKRARLVVKLRERGETVDDIAKDLKITKARVYQILKKAGASAGSEKTGPGQQES